MNGQTLGRLHDVEMCATRPALRRTRPPLSTPTATRCAATAGLPAMVRSLAACLFLAFAAPVCRADSDRLVEFSIRTLPRLDQLPPAADVPTALGPVSGAATSWQVGRPDDSVRPSTDAGLCLHALVAKRDGAVVLRRCAGHRDGARALDRDGGFQQWHWDEAAGQLSLLQDAGLCVSSQPIGIVQSLSLQPCGGAFATAHTRWTRGPNGTFVDGPGRALLADSVHPGVRDVVGRLAPLFRGSGPTGDRVLLGCFGWLLDLCLDFTGNAAQQLPIVNPEAPQWSTGNAT